MQIFFLLLLFVAMPSFAEESSKTNFLGTALFSNQSTRISLDSSKKALVIAFLSAKCPCSNSHVDELRNLANKYPEFNFVAVHSNVEEPKSLAAEYFKQANLPFPVLEDSRWELADRFKALKTPHVFVVDRKNQILYQGGVSDRRDFQQSEHKYLREALAEIQAGKPVSISEGRTLGCSILRKDPS